MADGYGPNSHSITKERAELERLRDQMEQAKALYESAIEAYERERERLERDKKRPGKELARAQDITNLTLRNYQEALRQFSAKTLRKKWEI